MFPEKVNEFVFRYRKVVLIQLRIISFFVALVAVGCFVFYYGFDLEGALRDQIFFLVRTFLVFFLFNFLVRLLFHLDRRAFLQSNWLEALLVLLLSFDLISYYVFNVPVLENFFLGIGIQSFVPFYILTIQLYLLLFAGVEVLRMFQQFYSLRLPPITMFFASFLLVIFGGTGLLMLPEMTVHDGSMPFVEALFTATSATCVTGLIVVETATYFTFKGQMVILIMMQLGGIGIVAFALFFSLFLRRSFGIKHELMLKGYFNAPDMLDARKLLGWAIGLTLGIEAIGIGFMYYLWTPHMEFERMGQQLFYSVFHSVSAFTNSGFTLFVDGYIHPDIEKAYMLHFVTGVLIFLGSIGFPVMREVSNLTLLRERMRKPWMDWSLNTKVALYSAVIIVVAGGTAFWWMEKDGVLAATEGAETVITSVFQIVTARSAGFNTVDINALGLPAMVLLIIIMFVGASSASVGGGIRTSTFVVILAAFWAGLRGKSDVVMAKRRIPDPIVNKAYMLFVFTVSWIFCALFALSMTNPEVPFQHLLFDTVSAFCTVGLSTGVPAELSPTGQYLMAVTIFIGRLGSLALVMMLGSTLVKTPYKYPKEEMMIG